ncbi:MAG: HAD-IA family hydrolase [Proteobacteria bacterium]|nr:HAD-IA family hydrolase [Pseudomonadota bacterium]
MNTQEDKAVFVLDLGAVIFNANHKKMYADIFKQEGRSDEELQDFVTNIFPKEEMSASSYCQSMHEITEPLAKEFPEHATLIRKMNVDQENINHIRGTIDGMEDVLNDLKEGGHKLYALTNWYSDGYELLEEKFPKIMNVFNGVVVSGDHGIKKPNPEIFKLANEAFSIKNPENTFFIDDKASNVTAARTSVGWNGAVFKDAATLRKVIAKTYNIPSMHKTHTP